MSRTVILETLRRQWMSIPFIGFVVLTTLVGLVASQMRGIAPVWPSFISLLTLIIGCQSIGPEFSSGTLQLILAKPINRSTYLLSRVAGVLCAVWIAALLPFTAEMIGRVASGNPRENITYLGWTGLNLLLAPILTCALLVFFGSFTRSYFNIALYLGLQIGFEMLMASLAAVAAMAGLDSSGVLGTLGTFLVDHPGVIKALQVVKANLYPDTPHGTFDRDWTLLVLCNAAVALFVACLLFRRREVPYGAD